MVSGYSRYTRKSQAVEIRDAIAEDAPDACQVLRRSIQELCAADHRNDPGILARWLENKTQDLFRSWLRQPGNSVLVAVGNGAILAVGAVSATGRITLNYVSPDARFQGVSRALLAALAAARQFRMHAHQHADRPTLLSRGRLYRDRAAGEQFRDRSGVSDAQADANRLNSGLHPAATAPVSAARRIRTRPKLS